jgi:exodeoxyribonuclease V beta subunit
LQPQRSLASRWWTASFSALTRELAHTGQQSQQTLSAPQLATERDARIDDALIDSATPAGPDIADAFDALDTLNTAPAAAVQPGYSDFPAGSSYGTLLHDLLEWQFERGWPIADPETEVGEPASASSRAWSALLARKTQRLQLDAAQSAVLSHWLRRIASAPLHLSAPAASTLPLVLADLDRSNAWAEMSFTLPVHALAAHRLDALITQHVLSGQPRSPLQPLQLEGMLIGFMDLVLEHEGRYFVLDYKSNRLASYASAQLQAAILEHRYDVQYTLYTLALHRLLKSRLPDYDYEQHVGGALYLFLRGVDQPEGGLFVDRPPRDLIESLDAAFAQQAPACEVSA